MLFPSEAILVHKRQRLFCRWRTFCPCDRLIGPTGTLVPIGVASVVAGNGCVVDLDRPDANRGHFTCDTLELDVPVLDAGTCWRKRSRLLPAFQEIAGPLFLRGDGRRGGCWVRQPAWSGIPDIPHW